MFKLVRYLYAYFNPELSQSGDEKWNFQFGVFTLAGIVISVLLLVLKEFFWTGMSNPVAETATLLLFVSGFYFFIRGQTGKALNLIFLVPLLIYFYYLADYENIPPPSETVYFTLFWFVCGLIFLGWFSQINFRFVLFFILGTAVLAWHCHSAGLLRQFLSAGQIFLYNPILLLLFPFFTIALARRNYDECIRRLREQEQSGRRTLQYIFQEAVQPLALIETLRDQDGNIIRMTLVKVNYAFESGFKISQQEVKGQELNSIFNFIFRNDTDWNDLLIIHPVKQTGFYSPAHERWFNLHFLWTEPDRCVAVFYDITDQKITMGRLEETRARYLALLEAIPDIFFVIDSDGIFQDVVFKGKETMAFESSKIIGNSIFNSGFSELMAGKISQCIRKAIENDTIETIEYSLDVKGTLLLFEMRLVRLNEFSVVAIARDITSRKRTEFELERAKEKAEEADALKSRFLANLSDDIRNPVSIILSMTKMLAETDIPHDSRMQFIRDVENQGNSLLNMIENTIYLSRIETNTLAVRFCHTRINPLLKRLQRDFSLQLSSGSQVQLILEQGIYSEDVGFDTDPALLGEALSRLLENAMKFSEKGTIRFGYEAKSNTVCFYVEDTGPGIPDQERENIFLRFYVIESDRKGRKSGLGLGLPIAQHFVALLGGELKLDSTPGKGTRFWFDLPLINPRGFMRIIQ